jgi:hypothetical protein
MRFAARLLVLLLLVLATCDADTEPYESKAVTDPSKSFRLTPSEPFLGTSIIPVLTDTGSLASTITSGGIVRPGVHRRLTCCSGAGAHKVCCADRWVSTTGHPLGH